MPQRVRVRWFFHLFRSERALLDVFIKISTPQCTHFRYTYSYNLHAFTRRPFLLLVVVDNRYCAMRRWLLKYTSMLYRSLAPSADMINVYERGREKAHLVSVRRCIYVRMLRRWLLILGREDMCGRWYAFRERLLSGGCLCKERGSGRGWWGGRGTRISRNREIEISRYRASQLNRNICRRRAQTARENFHKNTSTATHEE